MSISGLFIRETFLAKITAVLDGRGIITLYLKCKKRKYTYSTGSKHQIPKLRIRRLFFSIMTKAVVEFARKGYKIRKFFG
jgi:hypothetical protein